MSYAEDVEKNRRQSNTLLSLWATTICRICKETW